MPCCGRGDQDDPHTEHSLLIDALLEKDRKLYRVTHRLLLLGAAESGKSTIVKQMQIINLKGFSIEERQKYIASIYSNVREAIVAILGAMKIIIPPIKFEQESDAAIATRMLDSYFDGGKFEYNSQFFNDCQTLWRTREAQLCYERSNEYHLIDSAKYFFDKLPELQQETYLPDDQDILRCRVVTTQILEIQFKVKDAIFHMFDVGGQRDQRRKWIQCFNDATAIVFVTSLSGFNLVLREDENKNRFQESMDLFKQIWTNRFLKDVSVILFLNKQDLLLEKITANKFHVEDYFPTYKYYQPIATSKKVTAIEPPEFTKAKFFFRDSILSLTKESDETTKKSSSSSRLCFPHFTCAVDTNHMRKIFEDCRTVIQRIHLERFGIIAMNS